MDNDGMSNEQTEKVLQFQDITGLDDINVCRDILIRHQWDLEVAFQEHLNIREGRPSAYATESRAPQVVNDRFLQHVFAAQRGPSVPVPSGVGGMIGFVVNYVFNFCYSTLSSIVTAFLSLFKDRERSECIIVNCSVGLNSNISPFHSCDRSLRRCFEFYSKLQ